MIRELKHSSTQILTKIYFCREIFPFKQISLTYMCTAKTEPVLIGQLSRVFEIFSSPLMKLFRTQKMYRNATREAIAVVVNKLF